MRFDVWAAQTAITMVKLRPAARRCSARRAAAEMLVRFDELLRGAWLCISPKPTNRPPKIRTSVARNSHIPILLVSNCCSIVVK